MTFAPSLAAVFTAVPRFASVALLASTRSILQFGQIALAIARSSEISSAQPWFPLGRRVPPS